MSNFTSISLYQASHHSEYKLTSQGQEAYDNIKSWLKISVPILIVGMVGLIIMLAIGAHSGSSTFSDPYYWKAMAMPFSITLTGILFSAFSLKGMNAKLKPEMMKKFVYIRPKELLIN